MHVSKPVESIMNMCYDVLHNCQYRVIWYETYITVFCFTITTFNF